MTHGETRFDQKYYKRFFRKYDKEELDMYYRWSLGWLRLLDKYLNLKSGRGKRVLEIGCSIGAFAKVLKERRFEVVATDVSPYIIKKARKLQKAVEFKVLDIEREPRKKEDFDYVFAFEVLEHLKNPQRALNNLFSKLKKGGVLIFSTPFPTKRSLSDPTHINIHGEDWWLRACRKAGFQKGRLIPATFIPFFYRYTSFLSRGLPFRTNLPYINSTCFFIFRK